MASRDELAGRDLLCSDQLVARHNFVELSHLHVCIRVPLCTDLFDITRIFKV